MKALNRSLTLILALGLSGAAAAVPTDLSLWSAEGSGTWTVSADHRSVYLTGNEPPSVFYSNFEGQGQRLTGTLEVTTAWDDDYVGFVLGFQPGDVAAAATDFILIDWKKSTQHSTGWGCDARAGLSVSHVTGGLPNAPDTWCHQGTVTELARAATLGSTGWTSSTGYDFELLFLPERIQLFIEGVKEIDIAGSFANGRVGFYSYSQAGVRFSNVSNEMITAVPEPAAWLLMATGLAVLGRGRRFS